MCFIFRLNLLIPEGSLVAVVGQVGSGKSTFISTLCGETEVLEGRISVKVRNILMSFH